MRGFYIRGPFATIARLDATVAFIAEILGHLGDDSTLDDRRVKAVLLLANPTHAVELLACVRRLATTTTGERARPVDWSRLLPAVTVYVHLYGEPDSDGSPASRATARSPRPGSAATSAHTRGSPSSRSSTSPARRPSTPTRSPTDIDRPCI